MTGIASSALAPRSVIGKTVNGGRERALNRAFLRQNTLANSAAKAGILFGCAIGRDFFGDPDYVEIVSRECSLLCANLMSTSVTRRFRNGFDFALADQQVAFANDHGLSISGGYLVVHGDEPGWITPDTDRATALTELQAVVTTPIKRFAGQLDHWIVVNEALTSSGLRPCTWLSAVGGDPDSGTDYISEAFVAARASDPAAVLVLNDYGLEGNLPEMERKRNNMLALLKQLKRNNVPVDALGIQAHLLHDRGRIDERVFRSFLDAVHDLGLKLVVTELDVVDTVATLPPDLDARDSAVAQTISDFLGIMLASPGVNAITCWGLSDNHSWYNNQCSTPTRLRRYDGLPSRGTLLDAYLRRKQAYFAVRAALEGRGTP
jgi:endo-1,4-beta-xylanase